MIKSNSIKKLRNLLDEIDNKLTPQETSNIIHSKFNKHSFILDDSGWLFKSLDVNDLKTIHKGNLLPKSLSVSYSKEIDIPISFLPYIDFKLLVQTPPDSSNIGTYANYSRELYTGNYIEIKGDGSNIYKGDFPLPSDSLISDSQLNIVAPSANTKKVWDVTVLYTALNGDKHSVHGELIGIDTFENHRSCSITPAITIDDMFQCRPSDFAPHKIISFDENGFTGKGDYHAYDWDNPGVNCDATDTTTEGIVLSKSFSSVYNYYLYVYGSDYNITQGYYEGFGDSSILIDGSKITDINNIIYKGNRIYYSSLTQKVLKTSGSGQSTILSNLPNESDGDTLPYSSMTLQKNLGPLSSILDTVTTDDIFIRSTLGNIVNGNAIRKDIAFFQISPETDKNLPKYLIKINSGITFLLPAIIKDTHPDIPTQNNIYTVVSGTYAETSEDEGYVSEAYMTDTIDVKYRILITLKNPLSYKEIKDYEARK